MRVLKNHGQRGIVPGADLPAVPLQRVVGGNFGLRPRIGAVNRQVIPPGKRYNPAARVGVEAVKDLLGRRGVLEVHLLIHVEKISEVEPGREPVFTRQINAVIVVGKKEAQRHPVVHLQNDIGGSGSLPGLKGQIGRAKRVGVQPPHILLELIPVHLVSLPQTHLVLKLVRIEPLGSLHNNLPNLRLGHHKLDHPIPHRLAGDHHVDHRESLSPVVIDHVLGDLVERRHGRWLPQIGF